MQKKIEIFLYYLITELDIIVVGYVSWFKLYSYTKLAIMALVIYNQSHYFSACMFNYSEINCSDKYRLKRAAH